MQVGGCVTLWFFFFFPFLVCFLDWIISSLGTYDRGRIRSNICKNTWNYRVSKLSCQDNRLANVSLKRVVFTINAEFIEIFFLFLEWIIYFFLDRAKEKTRLPGFDRISIRILEIIVSPNVSRSKRFVETSSNSQLTLTLNYRMIFFFLFIIFLGLIVRWSVAKGRVRSPGFDRISWYHEKLEIILWRRSNSRSCKAFIEKSIAFTVKYLMLIEVFLFFSRSN